MRILWICHPKLSSLSVQDTIYTALMLAYPETPKITIVSPKHLSFQPQSTDEMLQQVHREIQRHNIQRVVLSIFQEDVEAATSFIHRCGEIYATTVCVFDHPFFLPENIPTIEEWLRQSWRNAVVKDTMVSLSQCWEVVGVRKRRYHHEPNSPYAQNFIEF